MHVSDKITLGNRGRRVIMQDIARAQCAFNPVEKAAYKAAAHNKLELLACLDLLTVKQYNGLKTAIDTVSLQPVQIQQPQRKPKQGYKPYLTSAEKRGGYHNPLRECCLGGKWYNAVELAQEIKDHKVLVINHLK